MSEEQISRTKRLFRTVFNPKLWMNWEGIVESIQYLKNGILNLFVIRKAKKTESLDDVMQKMHLSEEDITYRKKLFFRMSLLMVFIALLVFAYTMLHLFESNYLAVLVSFIAFFISLALAFRYHFWYYQLKVRKLGCSFNEWLKHGLLGAKQ